MRILVITEQRQGKWNNASFETLAAAQQIAKDTASTVSALVIGKGVSLFAGELVVKNVAEVLRVEHDVLEVYPPDGYCIALKQAIESIKPDLVLFPPTYQVRVFAPQLAAVLGQGILGHLTQAPLIVAIGRGIKAPENIPQAEALAKALGAEIAASRPICDEGWLPMERQIGSSGQTVAPKLYLALGISGAIQHVVGMKGARTIVAINKDSNAPIFEIADYGVVGDIFEIMPALSEVLQNAK